MPFYWMNSIMMVFVILFSMVIMYNFKSLEKMKKMLNSKDVFLNLNFMW